MNNDPMFCVGALRVKTRPELPVKRNKNRYRWMEGKIVRTAHNIFSRLRVGVPCVGVGLATKCHQHHKTPSVVGKHGLRVLPTPLSSYVLTHTNKSFRHYTFSVLFFTTTLCGRLSLCDWITYTQMLFFLYNSQSFTSEVFCWFCKLLIPKKIFHEMKLMIKMYDIIIYDHPKIQMSR